MPTSRTPDVGDDELRVTLTVTEIESVRDVLASLASTDATVEPADMEVVDPQDDSLIEIDVGEITPKQWEALELAFERGYYDRPRRTDLSALAAELDISKSAVSQRLRAAETRLVSAVLQSVSPWVVLADEP